MYQALVEKMHIHQFRKRSRYKNSFAAPYLIWNPKQAHEAEDSGEDIKGFLAHSDNLNVKILLMDALRKGNYDVQLATETFIAYYNETKFLIEHGNVDEFAKIFTTDHFTKTKDFEFVTSSLNCSKETALINYYRWKSSSPSRPLQYLKMKQERHKESDVCEICDTGGALIVCDRCNKAYHLYCLAPPLTDIPEGDWFCSECTTRSPSKLRIHKISSISPQDKSSRASHFFEVDACLNSALPGRFESLKFIHKELFSGLEKPSICPHISLSSPFRSKVKQATYTPDNMYWDRTQGFWVENQSLRQNDSSPEAKQKDSSNTTNGSNRKDDADPIGYHGDKSCRKDIQTESVGESTLDKTFSDVPVPVLRGYIYEVRIPVSPEGLLIYIQKGAGRFTTFSGYRETSTGEIGFAQKKGLFAAIGDFILEVDSVPCFKKSFAEVRSLLKTSKPGATMRVLKMFHPEDIKKHVIS
jgi:hypothetical protein